jgi:hypothetical protein
LAEPLAFSAMNAATWNYGALRLRFQLSQSRDESPHRRRHIVFDGKGLLESFTHYRHRGGRTME